MRTYRLLIDGVEFAKLDKNNPTSIRCIFDLKQYEDTMFPYGSIELHNLSSEYYKALQKFFSKRIEFYASVEDSPLTRASGIKTGKNNLLAFGVISNFIFNPFNGAGNSVRIVIENGVKSSSESKLILMKEGENVKQKIKEALGACYKSVSIKIDGLNVLAKFSENLEIDGLYDASAYLEKYNCEIKRSKDGFLITDKNSKTSAGIAVNMDSHDFIGMPSQINIDTIQAALHLRGDLALNSIININQSIFSELRNNDVFAWTKATPYITGRYRIVEIWHLGDSRNASINSWCTNIKAVKSI